MNRSSNGNMTKVGGGDDLFGRKVRSAQKQCGKNKNIYNRSVKIRFADHCRKKSYILGTLSIAIRLV